MKKLIAILISICILITVIPFSAYAAEITPEISLDEFTEQLSQLKKEYSGNYISELVFDDGTEVYHIDGEAESIYDDAANETVEAVVSDDDFEIPLYVLEENSALYNEENEVEYETAAINETEDEELEIATVQDAEELGYEVEIDDGTAVLTQPY